MDDVNFAKKKKNEKMKKDPNMDKKEMRSKNAETKREM